MFVFSFRWIIISKIWKKCICSSFLGWFCFVFFIKKILFVRNFWTLKLFLKILKQRKTKFKKYSVSSITKHLKLTKIKKILFLFWKCELVNVKKSHHKSEISTFVSMSKLERWIVTQCKCVWKKKLFFLKVL